MKIAVTFENGQVFQHFGHTEQFKIYEIADGAVTGTSVADTNGSGHSALAGFLQQHGVDTLICGGIGGGARVALEQAGIQLYGGVSGSADQAVADLLAGTLAYNPDVSCSHHHEGEEHDCAHHSCGDHSCGNH
ncbi:dinitrogenase iron-molybdenum cofactor biosynthesis protein [Pseudoflavonifractor sp. AF19-9AC]|uniref:NifB/NifX family molybdenum-iron cluster-binding protein n=1 Tax=Pseudoflavonifractor sp. AF19-9AC TaxID=2292244 RepID=UPI000E54B134|nr:NifB/NifX family molybdenum-iron cluster-binding protein [Pseudoflavonifractor sp. AF19-9AC]RHR10267.1 dinitrogenase iron-molybdenum cofactor biosynthesis protein [Pseudoflavonifractor sp. AF19-9AC]